MNNLWNLIFTMFFFINFYWMITAKNFYLGSVFVHSNWSIVGLAVSSCILSLSKRKK